MESKEEGKEGETLTAEYRIDVELWFRSGSRKTGSCFMQVTGIPKDLPGGAEEQLEQVVRQKFAERVGSVAFLETYQQGASRAGSAPEWVSVGYLSSFFVTGVTKQPS